MEDVLLTFFEHMTSFCTVIYTHKYTERVFFALFFLKILPESSKILHVSLLTNSTLILWGSITFQTFSVTWNFLATNWTLTKHKFNMRKGLFIVKIISEISQDDILSERRIFWYWQSLKMKRFTFSYACMIWASKREATKKYVYSTLYTVFSYKM